MPKSYVQCVLKKDDGSTTQAWINKGGARKGNRLKLLDLNNKDWWNVVKVYDKLVLTEDQMKKQRDAHREGLSSIR